MSGGALVYKDRLTNEPKLTEGDTGSVYVTNAPGRPIEVAGGGGIPISTSDLATSLLAQSIPLYAILLGAKDVNGVLQALNIGASGELKITDIAVRPGENATDNAVETIKKWSKPYTPAKTTKTNFTTQVNILEPVDLSMYPNIAITVNNTGSNAFTEGTIWFSPDNTTYESYDSSTFGTLGAGVIKSLQISNNSRRYMKITATAGTATSSDTWLTCNAG